MGCIGEYFRGFWSRHVRSESQMTRIRNNNDDGGEDSRKLWPFFFIIPILGFSFLPITGTAPVQAPGQWENFPCGQTNCNCSINSGDECQLFNNEAYYGIYSISPDGNLGNA